MELVMFLNNFLIKKNAITALDSLISLHMFPEHSNDLQKLDKKKCPTELEIDLILGDSFQTSEIEKSQNDKLVQHAPLFP